MLTWSGTRNLVLSNTGSCFSPLYLSMMTCSRSNKQTWTSFICGTQSICFSPFVHSYCKKNHVWQYIMPSVKLFQWLHMKLSINKQNLEMHVSSIFTSKLCLQVPTISLTVIKHMRYVMTASFASVGRWILLPVDTLRFSVSLFVLLANWLLAESSCLTHRPADIYVSTRKKISVLIKMLNWSRSGNLHVVNV